MILFKKIRWKNFLSTGNVFTEIDFLKSKSTLIVGENGAGKSTLLDALSYALYSKPFRSITKPQLINSINQKGMVVELEFNAGNKEYKIIRGAKPTIFEIYQNGQLINQNAEAREYQEMLEKHILKLSQKSFNQIVILGSASFTPFMQLSAMNRREVIEDLLDIQIFTTMNVLLKERITQNKTLLTETSYQMKTTADKIELVKKHIQSLKRNNDELIKQKEDKISELQNNINKAQTDIASTKQAIDAAKKSIEDKDKAHNKLDKIRELEIQLDDKITKLKKEIMFFEEHDSCPTCRQGIEHEHKHQIVSKDEQSISEVESGRAKLTEQYDQVKARIKEISEIQDSITGYNSTVTELNTQVIAFTSFINSLNTEIDALKSDATNISDNNTEINSLKSELVLLMQKKEDLTQERSLHEVAHVLLKDTGIKTKIIKQYVPIMNKLINKYLASMDFFVNFELNEQFEETIKSRFRDEFTYASFSEGEKLRIDLSLLFTWRAIAKLRNSATTNLLIMDEIFDSSLDNSGTEEFLKILSTLTSDTNIFIISHKGDQLYDKFHSVIKFEKHKNFSRMA